MDRRREDSHVTGVPTRCDSQLHADCESWLPARLRLTMGAWSRRLRDLPVTRRDTTVHELSIMGHLLGMVEEEAARVHATRVVGINLIVGDRTHIVDDSLLFCFELLAADTVAQGAQLNITRTATQFHCERDGDYTPAGDDFRCPTCQGVGALTDRGNELLVESIEVET